MGLSTKKPTTSRQATTTAGMRNMVRHPNTVTMKPLATGASAGPKVIMQPPMERKVPSLGRGARASTEVIMVGMNRPVPTEATRRAMSSSAKLGARAHATEPARRMALASEKISLTG